MRRVLFLGVYACMDERKTLCARVSYQCVGNSLHCLVVLIGTLIVDVFISAAREDPPSNIVYHANPIWDQTML